MLRQHGNFQTAVSACPVHSVVFVGKIRDWFTGGVQSMDAALADAQAKFAVDANAVDPAIFGLTSYAIDPGAAPRVSRKTASQVPAVKRVRDLVAGTLGTLPVELIGPDNQVVLPGMRGGSGLGELLAQPEPDVPASITYTRTFEDMLYDGVAWWRITEFGWHGYPTKVRRLDPRTVNVRRDGRVYVSPSGQQQGSAEVWVEDKYLIRFDSPNDALLEAGARAIRAAAMLDDAAARFADGAPPVDYFTPAEDADPFDNDDETAAFLDDWKTARKNRSTAYVPAAVKYNLAGWNPEQLQLADARQHANLQIALTGGVDPEEVGVSTTSRVYTNQFDRRKQYTDFTLGAYRQAFEGRLSMGDVTPGGYAVRMNLSAFLRSDDKTRMETYEIALRVGAMTPEEVRAAEGRPALEAPAPTPAPEETTVSASFDATMPAVRLDAPGAQTFEVDVARRTISGLAVPYGVTGRSGGQSWSFGQGTLTFSDVSRVKLWVRHDPDQAVGVATALEDKPDGLHATFKVARGAEGDRALELAEDGVLDGLSIGLAPGGKFQTRDGVHFAVAAPLMEVSLTPAPVYDDARVHSVAASATEGNSTMENDTTAEVTEATTAPDFEQLGTTVRDSIAAGFEGLGPRLVIPAGGTLEVNEPAPYRFDGGPAAHDFSTDLISGLRDGNGEAYSRVMTFIGEAFTPRFDVDTSNVATLNPAPTRPEMYVDQRKYSLPFYRALYKGTLSDITPFIFPKFSSASGLVGPHTEGVEPTPGSFAATSQTVTPTAVSGKAEITREVWEQGGNPQVSGLLWNKMVTGYYEGLEASAVAVLDAASPTAIALTTAETDADLVDELEEELAMLQFIRGGFAFDFAGTHIDLYKALAAASDTTGRKLLPMYGPTNANGQSRSRFASLDVAGVEFAPAWSLGATGTVSESSYLVDSSSVHVWNSAPKRLEFQHRVAYVDLAIWGYVATAISDLSGVREITYDPAA